MIYVVDFLCEFSMIWLGFRYPDPDVDTFHETDLDPNPECRNGTDSYGSGSTKSLSYKYLPINALISNMI